MSDIGGPYLFNVGVIALAHSSAPVRNTAPYVRESVTGAIDAVVPYPALFGAHTVLTTYYGYSNRDASLLIQNFMDVSRINWYDRMLQDVVRGCFSRASEANGSGRDEYYAQVAIDESVTTVLMIDDESKRFQSFKTEVILSPDESAEVNNFLKH